LLLPLGSFEAFLFSAWTFLSSLCYGNIYIYKFNIPEDPVKMMSRRFGVLSPCSPLWVLVIQVVTVG